MRERRNVGTTRRKFTEVLKRQVIDYYLLHGCSKREVWEMFIGQDEERGRILRWMRQLKYVTTQTDASSYLEIMDNEFNRDISDIKDEDYNERIKELTKQLEEAKLKTLAYSKMIEIAEQEFKISIRKKFNTKL